jgi:hypothetical protein
MFTIKKEITVFLYDRSDKAKPGDLAIEFKHLDYYEREKIFIVSLRTPLGWTEIDFFYYEFGKERLKHYWGIDLGGMLPAKEWTPVKEVIQ